MPQTGERAIAMLMQMTADDEANVVAIQPIEQACAGQRCNARGSNDVLGGKFQEERLVQEERDRPPSSGAQRLIEPLILCVIARQTTDQYLRSATDQAAAAHIQCPTVAG